MEHPFGNLKQWVFGNTRFLLRHLSGVRTEMALAVQAYNLKRAIRHSSAWRGLTDRLDGVTGLLRRANEKCPDAIRAFFL